MFPNPRRDICGKAFAVYGKRAAGGNPVFVGAFHNQRTGKAHFLMQKPDGIVCAVIGTQRIGADQFGKTVCLMRRRTLFGLHLIQPDGNPAHSQLPRCLGSGKAGSYHICT